MKKPGIHSAIDGVPLTSETTGPSPASLTSESSAKIAESLDSGTACEIGISRCNFRNRSSVNTDFLRFYTSSESFFKLILPPRNSPENFDEFEIGQWHY